jgi:hypothetical protein
MTPSYPPRRRNRRPAPARARPRLEALEDRTLPAVRFVIPLGLPADNTTTFHSAAAAFIAPGLASGDVIQVEPGSSPGTLFNSAVNAAAGTVANLSLQGDPAFPASELPEVVLGNAVTVGATRAGFTLKNLPVHVTGGTLTFTANGTVTDCLLTDDFSGTALHFNGTTAARLQNSQVVTLTGGLVADATVEVTTAAGALNRIERNEFFNELSATVTPLLTYQGANAVADVVRDNRFFGGANLAVPLVSIEGGASGVTFQNNLVTSASSGVFGVRVNPLSQNVQLLDNTVNLTGAGSRCLVVDPGAAGTTSVVVARNRFNTNAAGIGLDLAGTTGSLTARVEGNDFHNDLIGVRVSTTSVLNIDLGGGSQGSGGGNNFRGYRPPVSTSAGAVVALSPSGQTLVANSDLFNNTAITTPDDVFFDFNDDPSRADVQALNSLSTNQSLVQALYVRFLRRVGNVTDPADAGAWVNLLTMGTPAATVANGIVRSAEALGHQVDDLYRQFLGRDPDPAGRAGAVAALSGGGTLEQLIAGLVASPEYALRYASDAEFAQSLYYKLLGRTPSAAELAAAAGAVPGLGRAGLANLFLSSAEYRGREVRRLYGDLLHRAAAPAEVSAAVGTGLDVLSITALIAGSDEYKANG